MSVGCILIPHFSARVLLEHDVPPPVAVVSSGHVISVGPQARSSGVEPAMTVGRAQTLCADLSVVSPDRALENAEWERVEKLLNSTTPYVETVLPGRSYIEPHDREKLRSVVAAIDAQSAIAPTRIDAHLAARKAVEGELLEIEEGHLRGFRRDLPVEKLVGVGVEEEVAERLALFGYDTVASAGDLSRKHLKAQFGESGEVLYDRLNAEDNPSVSVYSPAPTVERTFRFERPRQEPGPLKTILKSLVEKLAEELDGRTAQGITLELAHHGEGRTVTSRTLREPENRPHALESISSTLLEEALKEGVRIEEMIVRFGALANPEARQGKLFFERPAVQKAIRTVHQKYPGSLQRAVLSPEASFEENRVTYETARA